MSGPPSRPAPVEVLALGEVMLRLDPGEGRISTARSFTVWEGGGEYNAVRALATTFGRRAGVVTALVDDPVGHLVEGLVRAGGVDVTRVRWVGADAGARTGLNYVERGHGVRGALGVSDRAGSAASRLAPGDVDWDAVLDGAAHLHTGGVFAGLSETTTALAEEALRAARRLGVSTSYDVNHRPSLWRSRGGADAARAVDLRLAGLADVVLGALQLAPASGELAAPEDVGAVLADLGSRWDAAGGEGPPLLVSSWRRVVSAGSNDWGAAAWSPATGAVVGPRLDAVGVLDRIGSGDALSAGVLDGVLTARAAGAPLAADGLERALALGVAAGALTMTTPGDTCAATLAEVRALAAGGTAHVQR
ncbi:PfkB family carbohydrate kinase [Quadrisphaera sp. INWT6]|uniref:PfkB family carbohydrate kinase n=1 Tax=Quadrisphaera sp. INWT6 TaxID=2596917 RepID=UPI0019D58814|nr:PfkB family carbohydrate kinase [Quadrisphaera sp. INWT6]